MRLTGGLRWITSGVVVCTIAVPGARAANQPRVSAADLKAAFLLNFVTFTEWPAATDSPIHVCIVADRSVGEALAVNLRSRAAASHPIAVDTVEPDASLRGCHAAFIGAASAPLNPEVFDQFAAAATLTVSDTPRFAEAGGMIELYLENGRMRFAVNIDALQRARLRLSSRVLSLARIVKDNHAP